MAQPTPYSRTYNFTLYQQQNAAAPYVGSQHDTEFNNVMATLDETLENLALIQRDDGGLLNAIVTPDSLDQATINMIGEWTPRGAWVTATNYAVRDMVTPTGGTVTYVCAVAHTSGATFAADLALGYWQQVNGAGIGVLVASNFTFTATDRLLGRSTAGAGTGEEITCTSFGRSLIDDANAAAGRTTLGLGAADSPSFTGLTLSTLTMSALAPSTMVYLNAASVLTATASATDGQLLIGVTGPGGSPANPVLGNLTGTANQVVVTNSAGSITLSLPQSIATSSSPTFGTVNLTNLSAGQIPFTAVSSALTGSNSFVWDSTNTRLGIGTSTPQYNLDIQAAAGTTTARIVNVLGGGGTLRFERSNSSTGFNIGQSLVGLGTTDMGVTSLDGLTPYFGANSGGLRVASGAFIGFASSATALDTPDTFLYRDGASYVIAQRNLANAQTFRVYRTFTDASNYERMALQSGAGYFELAAETAGTGTDNISVRLTPSGTGEVRATNNFNFASSAARIIGDFSNATVASRVTFQSSTTNGSTNIGVIPNGTSNVSSLAAYSATDPDNAHWIALQTSATLAVLNSSANGTGTTRALSLMVASTARFVINTSGVCNVAAATATPAAGSTTASLLFGTTAAFGVYYGSGAPTVAGAKGSLYLRSDGGGVNDRMYVATDSAGTWTAVVTVA